MATRTRPDLEPAHSIGALSNACDDRLIRIRGLLKTYPLPGGERLRALEGVSLDISHGEAVCILGGSGSGKTTLLEIIGLLSEFDLGVYQFEGIDVPRLGDGQRTALRREAIGFVFQSFRLLPHLSALENILLPRRYVRGGRDRPKALELLARLGLADRSHHRPEHLSGGEQQRVALARALINRPRLIIADEPTGNLDATSAQSVLDILFEERAKGAALMVVTHAPEVARRFSRVICVAGGQVTDSAHRDRGASA